MTMISAPKEDKAQQRDKLDLKALYETSRVLSTSLELDFVLNNLLLTAMSKLMTPRGMVLLFDPIIQGYRVASKKGRVAVRKDETFRLDEIPDDTILADGELPEALYDLGLGLVLPIAFGHRKIGLLVLGAKATGEAFTPDEMDFMRSLVNMSSSAVHNALLVEELQEANRDLDAKVQELNTLFDLSQEFSGTHDRNRVGKLLSFALMGQMMVRKHLFLIQREDGDPSFEILTSHGMKEDDLPPEMRADLCQVQSMKRLDDESEMGGSEERLRALGFELVVPVKQEDRVCALLALGSKLNGEDYDHSDVEFLSALGNIAFVSVQNVHLVEQQIEKRRMEEEIQLAREIQERLLPRAIPSAEGVTVAGSAHPSRLVGGDYFDVQPLSGGRLFLAIADVTGKGVPAALLMANVQACTHALLPVELTLEAATRRINEVVCGNTSSSNFITFFHCIYRPSDRTLEYVNAGHDAPILIRSDGSIRRLEKGGLLLGVMGQATYESDMVDLESGDTLVMFTDGVTEAMNPAEEYYGEERLLDLLRRQHDLSAGKLLDVIREDVLSFAGHPAQLSDDLTAVVLKVD